MPQPAYYTKNEIHKLLSNYYTKDEVNKLIKSKSKSISLPIKLPGVLV